MFSKLTTFALLLQSAFGAVSVNDVDTRYFVSQFNEAEFGIAVDRCVPYAILENGPYQMVECTSETTATWTLYTDNTCTTPLATETANSSTQTGLGNYFDFNCDSSNVDAYASVEFSIGTCDTQTKVTMDAALNTCVQNTGVYILNGGDLADADSLRVYCDDTVAELQYFDNPDSFFASCISEGDNSNFYQVRNATTTCGYMLTTDDVNIFGKLITCELGEVTTTTEEPDSASSLSIVGLVIATIFVSLSM